MGSEWWMSDTFTDRFAALCLWLTLQTTDIRSKLNSILASSKIDAYNIQLVSDIARKCQDLDQGFVRWSQSLPNHYKYSTAAWVTKDEVGGSHGVQAFPGRVDVFPDQWIACIWNTMRCTRLELACLMSRCIAFIHSPVDYRSVLEYTNVSKQSCAVIKDLIASIPYQLGWSPDKPQLLGRTQTTSFLLCGGVDGGVMGLSAFIAIWPLVFIQQQDHSTQLQRDWAKGQLEYIGRTVGVGFATSVSRVRHVHFPI